LASIEDEDEDERFTILHSPPKPEWSPSRRY
jgi:hypothetical protein